MPLPKLSLQVFEAFEQVAQTGSMRGAAREMGVSISSVSHHIARLEDTLGVTLFDRSARPFALTREGREALHHLSLGLQHLRRATSETAIGGLLSTRSLRIGIVEDFESNVAPDLAVALAGRMPRATLSISTVLSHAAPDLLRRGKLDLAIASEAQAPTDGMEIYPLLQDPFVMACPEDLETDPHALLQGNARLPFLRFNPEHLIGRQIAAHLARNGVTLPERYAFDSAQSMMAVIANGDGWAILTPLGFARAQRYAARVRLHPLPLAAFSRTLSLMARPDFDRATAQAIAGFVRQSARELTVDPVVAATPWLLGSFALRGPDGQGG